MLNVGDELGPYRIVGPLGRGGMGAVYRAVHRATGEPAAVKLLSPALAEEQGFRDRFNAEIETLLKLNHPNIVRLLGYGEQNGRLFYAMELVEGDSLEDELARGRRFSPAEVVHLGIQVCQALRHAHDRGIVHRDLKPGNLLLTGAGQVKLADFGIARLFNNTRRTQAGSILGTAEFMAPEQAEGKPVDPRSDLYSLGAVFYLLLARRPMFRAQSLLEMLDKQRHAVPEPLSRHAPECPAELVQLVMQLIEKRPEKRPANAMVVSRRLGAIAQSLPALAETRVDGEQPPEAALQDAQRLERSAVRPAAAAVAASEPDDSAAALPKTVDPPIEIGPTLAATAAPPGEALPSSRLCPTSATPEKSSPPGLPLGPTVAATAVPSSDNRSEPGAGGEAGCGAAIVVEADNDAAGTEAGTQAAGLPPIGAATVSASATASGRFVSVPREQLDPLPREEPANPFAVSLWTVLLAAALIGLGSLVWYFLQPPTAEALYERIRAKAVEGGAMIEAAEADIDDFLIRFPKDPRAATVREYQREVELRRLERRFDRRAKGLFGAENLLPIERAYFEAISVARTDIDAGIARLSALLDLYCDSRGDPGPQGLCLELARRRLEQLKTEIERAGGDLQAMLGERLAAARNAQTTDPEKSQRIYRAIETLYAGKPWAAKAVAEARQALGRASAAEESPAAPETSDSPPESSVSGEKPRAASRSDELPPAARVQSEGAEKQPAVSVGPSPATPEPSHQQPQP